MDPLTAWTGILGCLGLTIYSIWAPWARCSDKPFTIDSDGVNNRFLLAGNNVYLDITVMLLLVIYPFLLVGRNWLLLYLFGSVFSTIFGIKSFLLYYRNCSHRPFQMADGYVDNTTYCEIGRGHYAYTIGVVGFTTIILLQLLMLPFTSRK